MTGYPTPEEREAWLEEQVQKYRREQEHQLPVERRVRRRRWFLYVVLILLINPCTCCFCLYQWEWQNVPATLIIRFTKYSGAEKIDEGYYFPGSAPAAIKHQTYWTEDSVSSVVDHYEKYFRDFEQVPMPSWWSEKQDGKYPVIFRSASGYWDMYIMVLDADQVVSWVPATPHHYAVEIHDDVPKNGALIVITYFISDILD